MYQCSSTIVMHVIFALSTLFGVDFSGFLLDRRHVLLGDEFVNKFLPDV